MVFTFKTKKGNYHSSSITWVVIPVIALLIAIGVSIYAAINQKKYQDYYDKVYKALVSGKSTVTLDDSKLAHQAALRCVYSTPELFTVDNLWYSTMNGKTTYRFEKNGYAQNYEYNLTRFNEAIDGIVAKAPKFGSDREAIKWIHDYIIEHYDYDYSLANGNALAMLDTGKGTCNGYTALFSALAGRFGIEYGVKTNQTHTWNVVKLGWKWYHVDVTWDDKGSEASYEYYLVEDAKIRTVPDHLTWEDTGVSLAQYENRRNLFFILSAMFFVLVTLFSGIPMVYAYFKK